MRLVTFLFMKIGPTAPFLLGCSVVTFGVILSVVLSRLFRKHSDLHREKLILQWSTNMSIVFGLLGTLLGLRGVFPNISPGDPATSLSAILSGLGHALNSSVAGLSIAAIAEFGLLLAKIGDRGIPCKD